MKLEEAITLDDYKKVYREKFGKNPKLWEGFGTDDMLIDDIIDAIKKNEPLDVDPNPPRARY
tara:strand:- start:368 stop:553 length:186 start_codon:yes stop_codon:yes gene_type:complete